MDRRPFYAIGLGALALWIGCRNAPSPIQPTPLPQSQVAQTFSLSGDVYDIAGRPLGGSRVEAIDGPRSGTFTMTNDDGRFTMPGTFTGAVAIRASKDGYISATRTFSRDASHVFSLEPVDAPLNIAGEYFLTLTADSACANWPAEVRTRTIAATIVPSTRRGSFLVRPSNVRLFLFSIGMVGDYGGIYAHMAEPLNGTTHLLVDGRSAGIFGPTGITTPFDGYLAYCPGEPAPVDQGTWVCLDRASVSCDSHNHQLTLLRR